MLLLWSLSEITTGFIAGFTLLAFRLALFVWGIILATIIISQFRF